MVEFFLIMAILVIAGLGWFTRAALLEEMGVLKSEISRVTRSVPKDSSTRVGEVETRLGEVTGMVGDLKTAMTSLQGLVQNALSETIKNHDTLSADANAMHASLKQLVKEKDEVSKQSITTNNAVIALDERIKTNEAALIDIANHQMPRIVEQLQSFEKAVSEASGKLHAQSTLATTLSQSFDGLAERLVVVEKAQGSLIDLMAARVSKPDQRSTD